MERICLIDIVKAFNDSAVHKQPKVQGGLNSVPHWNMQQSEVKWMLLGSKSYTHSAHNLLVQSAKHPNNFIYVRGLPIHMASSVLCSVISTMMISTNN